MDYFGLALSFGEKLLGHIPDVDQKFRKKYIKLKKEYVIEKTKTMMERDDDKILSMRDELNVYLEKIDRGDVR